jgi:RNA polymerase sigma-70 factor (ECF subfamily)
MESQNSYRREVESQRDYLVRYASIQLRDAQCVQDVVQETLLAALTGEANFAGRSNFRTWLTGILKHKIVDAIRRASRETLVSGDAEGDGSEFDALFEANGHWVEHPATWNDPDASLQQQQFFAVLEECIKKLPPKTAQVFLMRELLGAETGEICKDLLITPTNCGVMLYRARMALQLCVGKSWFER